MRAVLFSAALSVLVLSSCSHENSAPVSPVRGRVLYHGKPAVGARVAFHPVDDEERGRPIPQAVVEPDGSFRLSTYTQHDGAPPGTYAVTILWPADTVKDEDGTAIGPDRLRRRYADPSTTPFHADVREGPNQLEPFQIK